MVVGENENGSAEAPPLRTRLVDNQFRRAGVGCCVRRPRGRDRVGAGYGSARSCHSRWGDALRERDVTACVVYRPRHASGDISRRHTRDGCRASVGGRSTGSRNRLTARHDGDASHVAGIHTDARGPAGGSGTRGDGLRTRRDPGSSYNSGGTNGHIYVVRSGPEDAARQALGAAVVVSSRRLHLQRATQLDLCCWGTDGQGRQDRILKKAAAADTCGDQEKKRKSRQNLKFSLIACHR